MGWLGVSSDRGNVTAAGNYSLAPEESPTGTPKLLRVARTGDSGHYFYVGFRQPYGTYFDNFAPTDPAVNGVFVRVGPDYGVLSQSWLVDCTPETSTFTDAALPVGRTYTDPLSGISFSTVSVSSTGAVVAVTFTPDTVPPSQPGNLVANATGPYTVAMSWTASTDNRGVAGYQVSRNGVVVGTTTATSYNDSGLAPSTSYSYSVVAYDAANNLSTPATASATTATPDTQAPTSPSNLNGTVNKSGVTMLTWTGSTDNVGVAGYRVYRNGSLFATTTATSYSARKARGTWTYYVVAFDGAGNVSGASNSVTVKV